MRILLAILLASFSFCSNWAGINGVPTSSIAAIGEIKIASISAIGEIVVPAIPSSNPSTDTRTVLLAHFNGSNGSTTFTDSSMYSHSILSSGNRQLSTSQYMFGLSSLYVTSDTGACYAPDSSDYTLLSGNFTIEFFLYVSVLPSAGKDYGLITQEGNAVDASWEIGLYRNTGYGFYYTTNGSSYSGAMFGSVPAINSWNHIALVRNGVSVNMYVNGVVTGSTFVVGSASFYDSSQPIRIGYFGYENSGTETIGGALRGYIDEVRISKGVARYTTNFTPPTSEFTQ